MPDPKDSVAQTVLADASVHIEGLQVRRMGEPENQPRELLWSDRTTELVCK